MATAASSHYSQDEREAGHNRRGSTGTALRGITDGAGIQSAGSSVVYEGENEHEEHHIRQGLRPTSEGAPIPEPSSAHHDHQPATGGIMSHHNDNNNTDAPPAHEQYTARDEGLEPYSAAPNHPASSGYLPEKKLGPATGETTTETAAPTSTSNEAVAAEAPATSTNNHEETGEKSGLAALGAKLGFGSSKKSTKSTKSIKDREDHDNDNNNATFLAAPLGDASGHRDSHDGGDHTDNEAAEMQPSQSYIARQSMYSQPPSEPARQQQHEQHQEPLIAQRTGGTHRSHGADREAPYDSNDYALQQGHLEPAGHGRVLPAAGVPAEEIHENELDRRGSYASRYTQPGMAGVGAGTLAAATSGHPENNEYVQGRDHYVPQQQQQIPQGILQNGQQQQQQPFQQLQQQPNEGQDRYLQQELRQPGFSEHLPEMQQHHNQQQQYPTQQGFAAVAPMAMMQQQPEYQPEQLQQEQQQPNEPLHQQKASSILSAGNGPTTAVQPIAPPPADTKSIAGRQRAQSQIGGGGLAAALATSGHDLTSTDKKGLKKELKQEKKYEKQLDEERKKEGKEIEMAIKMSKDSQKKCEKSGKYEANFRRTFEKAVKKEVRAKQHLLKIQNDYNKIAADLERATKEMELRHNAYVADSQTRDSDKQRIDDLRRAKGQHDMDREHRHGESVIKQNQAKRALSTKRKSGLF